ncbi:MAG: prolyl oligopeptidase family serine peptidase [Pirellulales bacterium]|nr:prolyl oligopeptidase family serine peptidase [Pirellulales bacterium]
MSGAVLVLLTAALVVRADTTSDVATDDARQELSVSQTFNDAPFRYGMRLLAKQAGYRVYRLTYPSPVVTPVEQNNTIPADYYLPDGIRPGAPGRPAVICMHILEGNFELVHMTCSVLASRGVPALMFKLPYYGERSLPGGREALANDPALFAGALSQAMQDVQRTVDVLASRPEIDPRRIGITGISLGGIVAATAAGVDPRLGRAALILAGGDLMHIVHHARETRRLSETIRRMPPRQRADLEARIREVDPLRHAAGLRERARQGRVMMINAEADQVIPPPCTEKLAAALGIAEKVVWLKGLGHYTAMAAMPQALQHTADFFAQDLPPGVKAVDPTPAGGSASRTVALLLQQAGALLVSDPEPGRCHFVDLELAATWKDGKPVAGKLRLVRGASSRFSIRCEIPGLGKAALGQGAYPWLASAQQTVFRGTIGAPAEPGNPLAYADEQHVLKLRMLSGALAAVAMAPEMLERWVTIADDPAAATTGSADEGGRPAIRIVRKANGDRKPDQVRLVLDRDGRAPQRLSFNVEGARGTVTFRGWQFNTLAHESLFKEPDNLTAEEVKAEDLHRVFSALFSFAMEHVQ